MSADRSVRRLALRREPLAELSWADLEAVLGAGYDATPNCPTPGLPCLTYNMPLCDGLKR